MNTPSSRLESARGAASTAPGTHRAPISESSQQVTVWDPLVRIGHWLLVAGFFVAFFTEEELMDFHVWAGYLVAGIVIVRIVWGLVGTRHAGFKDFVCGPKTALLYLRDLLRGSARRYIGHSPAGAAMVLMLLISVAATTWTGIMVYAYEDQAGPMAGYVADTTPVQFPDVAIIQSARADDDEKRGEHAESNEHDAGFEAREEFWEEGHVFFANFTLFLVLLHVLGVLLASFVHRENLVAAMFSGRKRTGDN